MLAGVFGIALIIFCLEPIKAAIFSIFIPAAIEMTKWFSWLILSLISFTTSSIIFGLTAKMIMSVFFITSMLFSVTWIPKSFSSFWRCCASGEEAIIFKGSYLLLISPDIRAVAILPAPIKPTLLFKSFIFFDQRFLCLFLSL